MKLATKLSLILGSMTCFIAALGVFGLYEMSRLNDASTVLAHKWLPASVAIETMNTNVSDYRNLEIRHIFSVDTKEMRELEQEMVKQKQAWDKLVSDYAAVDNSREGTRRLEGVTALKNRYEMLNAQLLDLSRDLKTTEAIALLRGQSDQQYVTLSNELDAVVAFVNAEGNAESDRGDALFDSGLRLTLLAIGLAVVMATGLAVYLVRSTMQLLGKDPGELRDIARSVAAGNLDLAHDDRAVGVYGDILVMVASLKRHIDNAQNESLKASQESERARKAMLDAETASAAAAVKAANLLESANRLQDVISVLSSASEELAAQIEQAGHGASRQADRVGETATAMEEMNATVIEVARSAASASGASARTREKADSGAKIVLEAVDSIKSVRESALALRADMVILDEHARAISRIMSVISDIADQTNLLALNAAIEAARAGEAGRGFAVVADEVRKLAEKTMASTTDVGNAIRAIQDSAAKSVAQVDKAVLRVEEATRLSAQSGNALHEIVELAENTADQVRAIATASEEQSATSEEINRAIGLVNSIATETACSMRESARAVDGLASQAQVLADLVEAMKRG